MLNNNENYAQIVVAQIYKKSMWLICVGSIFSFCHIHKYHSNWKLNKFQLNLWTKLCTMKILNEIAHKNHINSFLITTIYWEHTALNLKINSKLFLFLLLPELPVARHSFVLASSIDECIKILLNDFSNFCLFMAEVFIYMKRSTFVSLLTFTSFGWT